MYVDHTYHNIVNIKHYPIKRNVYNLEIEDNHNYYVGKKGILVHNMRVLAKCAGTSNCQNVK